MESLEHFFNCPYCGERISLFFDVSVGRQIYVEDCNVCCSPIDIEFEIEGDQIPFFEAKRGDE